MRSINKSFTKTEIIEKPVVATKEEIIRINEDKIVKEIIVSVNFKDNNELISNETIKIDNEMYDLLMSESPDFAQGKPLNEYRESDLFYVIDLIRADSSTE